MTTLTSAQAADYRAPQGPGPLARIANVVKLQFANPYTVLTAPWVILIAIFLVNLAIWWIIMSQVTDPADRADVSEGFGYSGASLFIFVYMMVVAIQSMNQTFNFALGMSVTRRDYYLGSAVTFTLLSVVFAAGMTVLGAIEQATDGWGVGGRMFTSIYFGDGGWFERFVIIFLALMFFFFIGAVAATVFVRWKAVGLTVLAVVVAVILLALVALATFTQSWGRVGEWFATTGFLGSALWSLVITAIAGVAGFFILRRATPRG